jgi:hypothetical protein
MAAQWIVMLVLAAVELGQWVRRHQYDHGQRE